MQLHNVGHVRQGLNGGTIDLSRLANKDGDTRLVKATGIELGKLMIIQGRITAQGGRRIGIKVGGGRRRSNPLSFFHQGNRFGQVEFGVSQKATEGPHLAFFPSKAKNGIVKGRIVGRDAIVHDGLKLQIDIGFVRG